MVLDVSAPLFNNLTVMGVLEIPDTLDNITDVPAGNVSEYRTVVLDATYISIQVCC